MLLHIGTIFKELMFCNTQMNEQLLFCNTQMNQQMDGMDGEKCLGYGTRVGMMQDNQSLQYWLGEEQGAGDVELIDWGLGQSDSRQCKDQSIPQ